MTDMIAQLQSSLEKAKLDLEAKEKLMDKFIVDGNEVEMKKMETLVRHAQASYERRLSALATLVGKDGGSPSGGGSSASSTSSAVSWLMILALFAAIIAVAYQTFAIPTSPSQLTSNSVQSNKHAPVVRFPVLFVCV